jgi:hypothetical protein
MAIQIIEPEWMTAAPCSGRTAEFFPGKTDLTSKKVRQARRVCLTRCPFRRECLEACYTAVPQFAVERQEPVWKIPGRDSSSSGLWGGTTPEERRRVAHLPVALRINVLLAWVRTDVIGPLAPAARSEIREEGA